MHRLEPGGLKIGNPRGSQMTYDIGCLFIYLFINFARLLAGQSQQLGELAPITALPKLKQIYVHIEQINVNKIAM